MNYFRQQGDVLLERIDALPDGLKKVAPKARGYVLAEGEVTGHAHVLDEIDNVEMFEKDGRFYVNVKKESKLTHEEHGTHIVIPGIYRVGGVREYDHFGEEVRAVKD